jgi:DNA-binding transcriptional ArsR family regulator
METEALDQHLSLLLHPVRLRLIHAMRIGGCLTTNELCQRLPDLPKATVYRQIERLLRGGVLRVESERKIRGAVERRLQLNSEAAVVKADDAKAMTLEDHRETFTAAMAALMADFGAYLDRPGANPFADKVSYRQFVIWLSPQERSKLVGELGRVIAAHARNEPSPSRAPHILSSVFFPGG